MTEQLPEDGATQSVRQRVLDAVARGDLGRSRKGIRWWLDEDRYRTLTVAERKHLRDLIAEGIVRFETAGGYRNGTPIGMYRLDPRRIRDEGNRHD